MTLEQLVKKPETANFVSVASQSGKLERLQTRFYASLDKPVVSVL